MLEWSKQRRPGMEQHLFPAADQSEDRSAADRDWQGLNPRVSKEQMDALRQKEKLVARRLRRQQQKKPAA